MASALTSLYINGEAKFPRLFEQCVIGFKENISRLQDKRTKNRPPIPHASCDKGRVKENKRIPSNR